MHLKGLRSYFFNEWEILSLAASFSFSGLPHFQEQNDLKGLLENLHQNIQTKKRKNVEIMWLAATVRSLIKQQFH